MYVQRGQIFPPQTNIIKGHDVLTENDDNIKHRQQDYYAGLYASPKPVIMQDDKKENRARAINPGRGNVCVLKMKPEKAPEVDNVPAELLNEIDKHSTDLML